MESNQIILCIYSRGGYLGGKVGYGCVDGDIRKGYRCYGSRSLNGARAIIWSIHTIPERSSNVAENQRIVFKLLSDLHAQGRTIVMVTHDENAGRLADRRVNLDHGRIKDVGVFTLLLREPDGSEVTISISPNVRVRLNGKNASFFQLRTGMMATTLRDGDKPADQVFATGR